MNVSLRTHASITLDMLAFDCLDAYLSRRLSPVERAARASGPLH